MWEGVVLRGRERGREMVGCAAGGEAATTREGRRRGRGGAGWRWSAGMNGRGEWEVERVRGSRVEGLGARVFTARVARCVCSHTENRRQTRFILWPRT